jgi:hypothetical protein
LINKITSLRLTSMRVISHLKYLSAWEGEHFGGWTTLHLLQKMERAATSDMSTKRIVAEPGWHNGFRSLVQCTNPTIWNFLTALKLEQGLTDQKITDCLMRRPPPPRAAKWFRYDAQLESFMQGYDNQKYEVLECLTAVSAAL